MNIFILSLNPTECAQMHADQHVGKMLLESCQLLCNAHDKAPYRRTHYNHPCSIWTRHCQGNYGWLVAHALALAVEYRYRFDKSHASGIVANWCAERGAIASFTASDTIITPFAQAMPEQYRGSDPVDSYRRYYATEKRILRGKPAAWTKRPAPTWF